MTIDGKDILTAWGIRLLQGSYDALFRYPKRKPVQYTNYVERDGITPDLREIVFEPKSVSLCFLMEHRSDNDFWQQYQRFFTDMSAPGYRVMDLDNGLIHTLRYDKTASFQTPKLYNEGPGITVFNMDFIEENHSIPDNGEMTAGGIGLRGIYMINGIDFAEFGVHPDGEIGKFLHYPEMKLPFTDGRTTDLSTVKYKHKELTIPLWMIGDNKEAFLKNYSAFFRQFNQTGKQKLFSKEIGGSTLIYYLDCPSFKLNWGKRIQAKFSLTLMVPVVTWLDVSDTQMITVLQDTDSIWNNTSGILADQEEKIIAFNK